jgi:hypothetical protein
LSGGKVRKVRKVRMTRGLLFAGVMFFAIVVCLAFSLALQRRHTAHVLR